MINAKNALLSVALIMALAFSGMATAETHVIKTIGPAFNPMVVFAEPGDTITWTNMSAHDTRSINGLIPEGAEPWQSQMGQNFNITLEEEGIYLYECSPHIGLGMTGAIVVGEPNNLAELEEKVKSAHGAVQRAFRKAKQAIKARQ
ncbi:blue (type 1) copper domain protein [Nitrosococcus halophilus Nc 4]|uniref:Blue (Type 1) copper domain protein n=1 Tax=Nitrosococcus halophilus (strain Nc4) TaxID=472759 RepID=D5C3H3_NITHN|nr:plastocyanin/azurin family copper-binding protein [Nitrosococcus halophilus]ADE16880.1 blue (type 1) copper domain protein [Nitrosococcus halophilus Nc 4]